MRVPLLLPFERFIAARVFKPSKLDPDITAKEATSSATLLDEEGERNVNYGYQFWIAKRKGLDIYYARGLWGQYVICIPKKDMIVVRLGKNYGYHLKDGHSKDFYAFVDAALEMYP